MKIRQALPGLFQKTHPTIDPKTETLSALSLLKFHEIDALPLSFDSAKKNRAVMGFSSLARIAQLDGKSLPSFLKQPCEAASEPLETVGAGRDIGALLDKFLRTRFGFARVEEKKSVGTLVGLWDLLALYENGVFTTTMTVDDVASRTFAMTLRTTAREALKAMFDKRIRRVFIGGSDEFVSDREIIESLFSPASLAAIAADPDRDPLAMPLSALGMMHASRVKPATSLKDAARMLRMGRGQCLIFDGKVVTPWDAIMKPWKANKLKVR